ncbi:MAG: TlpA family protein disulfide reductase [Oceanospirillaceae bacterium]|nr:TlpA family protein disulfide reductase [Oceanospirillaceae bacterium]
MKLTTCTGIILLWWCASFPAFAMEFKDFNGRQATLAQHIGAGKWTVVVFWSHSCAVCLQETPLLTQFHQQHRDLDAQVLGISIDGQVHKSKARQFMQRSGMGFPSYIGELRLLAADYYQITGEDFRGTPSYLLYSPSGELMGMQVGALRIAALEAFIAANNLD